jgi:cell wall-associated NlpC family hydrolase
MIADIMLQAHAAMPDTMPTKEVAERLQVVQEALTWMNTPYHHQGRIKGAGVDCGMLLLEVFEACGHIPHIDPRPYPPDWHLHRSEQVYLGWVQEFAAPLAPGETPMPGDLVLYRFGRCLSHGAIVVAWPTVIHSYLNQGVMLGHGEQEPLLPRRLAGSWSIWKGRG